MDYWRSGRLFFRSPVYWLASFYQAILYCLVPGDIPDSVEVDISAIAEVGDDLKVDSIVLPSNIELITELDHMMVSVYVPRAEVEVEEEVPADEVPSENGSPDAEAASEEK